jgi:hypothetical protein
MRFVLRFSVLSLLTLVAAACSEQSTEPSAELIASFVVVAGDGQEGAPGQELASPLMVQAFDERGIPARRALVNFRVVEGGGSMWAGVAVTDQQGLAQDYWTLGTSGSQRVEVRAVDPTTGAKQVFGEFVATFALVDADADGFDTSTDCDDTDPAVNPGAAEVLDGIDNDCDGQTDEGLFVDGDGDGFDTTTDCDDGDASVNPGATEVADGKDNDCDGDVDEGFSAEVCDNVDNDGDGTTDEDLPYCFAGSPAPNTDGSACNAGFFDLDGDPLNGCESDTLSTDADGDGFASDVDCDDTDPAVNPGAVEVVDGVDNDCDGDTDEPGDYSLADFRVDNLRTASCPAFDVCFDFHVTPVALEGPGGSVMIHLRVGPCPLPSGDLDTILWTVGFELTNTVSFATPAPEVVTICTWIDPFDQIPEGDEFNNRLEVDVRVDDLTIIREEFVS